MGRARPGPLVDPAVEDLQEDPLRPAVEPRVGGVDAAPGVVAEAQPAQLAAHDVGVLARRYRRMLAGSQRELLGRQAEGVKAHGVQDVMAGHPQVAGVDVGRDVALGVPDVDARAAGVREHVQHVELRLADPEPGRQRARPGWGS